MLTYEAMCGEMIDETARKMVEMVTTHNQTVTSDFNDVKLVARVGTTAATIVAEYDKAMQRAGEEYERSPAGKKDAREREAFQRQEQKAKLKGILPFRVKEPEKWQATIAVNQDDYGAAAVRYAARWANFMEKRMARGEKLADCAEKASHRADQEGITGFMHGAAVSWLAQVWEHGEELRQWHNLKTQLGHEGERSNESGGVLNPALLNIGS